MATNNAINLNASGLAKYDGAGTFSAETTTIHCPLIGAASNGITSAGPLTNGQLLIGSTGNDPSPATLSAGTGIGITNGAGSIKIDSTGGGLTWTVIAVNGTLAINAGIGANKAGALSMALPAAAAVGSVVSVIGMQGTWSITQAANQRIFIGSSASTLGAGGLITSTGANDCIELVCLVADLLWYARSVVGNISLT